ncbi:hypothetical protein [Lysinibacillus sp. G4S2]|nr:hypothetical protein [Lysinibacillus sp. G4S2]MDM5247109.1 hypothetical protein [Lysinibacillus sp. G4S2]
MGLSVTDETLERTTRVKRLIGRPKESAQSERKLREKNKSFEELLN